MGASAGATLALMSAREIMSGRTSVASGCLQGVVAIGPFTVHPDHVPQEYQTGYSSYIELGDTAPIISRAVMDRFFRYANLDADKSDAFILLHKDDFRQFPPVYVATASCDPLRDDGKILAAALRNAGVEVRECEYQGLPHGFWYFNSLPEWPTFIQDTVSAIQWIVGKSRG